MPSGDYLLDACAVLAFFKLEDGWEVVMDLFGQARRGEASLSISVVNLVEVYYDLIREYGPARTDEVFKRVGELPVAIIGTIPLEAAQEAARLKAGAGMSLADTFLVATALHTGATLVTCGHDELEPVEARGRVPFLWLRPRQARR